MKSERPDSNAGVAVGEVTQRRAGLSTISSWLRTPTLRWAAWVVLLTLLFSRPLTSLMLSVALTDPHSHILLVPFVSVYLLFIQRERLPAAYSMSPAETLACAGIGIAALCVWIMWGERLSLNDRLGAMALSFVCFVATGGFLLLGTKGMRVAAFPIAFLVFMIPLPDAAVTWLETASATASAEVAALFFTLSGMSFVRHGQVIELPGIVLEVAQECSGIRSSWVLFITSLLASHLFLRSPWRRVALITFVIPLGIIRNGFRILTIGLLCVHVGPHMINSTIHRHGGPFFFALSLVPLFLLLWWLRRGGRQASASTEAM